MLYPNTLQPWYRDVDLMSEGLVDTQEAAKFLSIGRTKLYELLAQERLPHVKIGKASRIPKIALKIFALKG
jgi:excisionase family DNA binding protein